MNFEGCVFERTYQTLNQTMATPQASPARQRPPRSSLVEQSLQIGAVSGTTRPSRNLNAKREIGLTVNNSQVAPAFLSAQSVVSSAPRLPFSSPSSAGRNGLLWAQHSTASIDFHQAPSPLLANHFLAARGVTVKAWEGEQDLSRGQKVQASAIAGASAGFCSGLLRKFFRSVSCCATR